MSKSSETGAAGPETSEGGRLAGKVAVVTGSSRGIGRAIARALALEGAAVAIHYCRGEEQAASLAREVEERGGRARIIQGDPSRPEECHKVFNLAPRALGAVDILLHNARGNP